MSDGPEGPIDPYEELTRAALEDPGNVNLRPAPEDSAPTLWRVLTVVAVAVAALALVFWRNS